MITVIIGGDVCPIGRSLRYFKNMKIDFLFNDLLQEIQNSDFSIVNLECPLINENTPIRKSGPVLASTAPASMDLKRPKLMLSTLPITI
jgi:poly-gamma-glutamate synthesis protein (capsule biosynthesis protein)